MTSSFVGGMQSIGAFTRLCRAIVAYVLKTGCALGQLVEIVSLSDPNVASTYLRFTFCIFARFPNQSQFWAQLTLAALHDVSGLDLADLASTAM